MYLLISSCLCVLCWHPGSSRLRDALSYTATSCLFVVVDKRNGWSCKEIWCPKTMYHHGTRLGWGQLSNSFLHLHRSFEQGSLWITLKISQVWFREVHFLRREKPRLLLFRIDPTRLSAFHRASCVSTRGWKSVFGIPTATRHTKTTWIGHDRSVGTGRSTENQVASFAKRFWRSRDALIFRENAKKLNKIGIETYQSRIQKHHFLAKNCCFLRHFETESLRLGSTLTFHAAFVASLWNESIL